MHTNHGLNHWTHLKPWFIQNYTKFIHIFVSADYHAMASSPFAASVTCAPPPSSRSGTCKARRCPGMVWQYVEIQTPLPQGLVTHALLPVFLPTYLRTIPYHTLALHYNTNNTIPNQTIPQKHNITYRFKPLHTLYISAIQYITPHYIHTYTHTRLHSFIHSFIQTYIHT